jgi:putative hydrolase of the HAD superfamily
MHVEAVLFDLFNTLIMIQPDNVFYIPSLEKLYTSLARNGVNASFENFKRAYFEVRDNIYANSEKSLEEPHFNVRVSQTLQKLGYNHDASHPIVTQASKAFADEMAGYMSLDPDARTLLQKLHRKYRLGVVSNFALPEFARELLERYRVKQFFDVILISGEVNRRKPSPEIYQRALKALNVDASHVVFVGDTPSMDVKGPKKAGMKAVLIERKTQTTVNSEALVYTPPDDGTKVEPDKIIKRLAALPAVLQDC